MTWHRTRNQTSHEACAYCSDTGWVELRGTITKHGYTYSRGSTACKFCELGLKRWTRMRDLHQSVIDDYTASDVEMPAPYVPASKADARAAIRAIQETWSKPRPVAIDPVETRRMVEDRITKAREALDAEPEPFAPQAPDDIPF